jgi:antitoxin PrlF
MPTIQAKVTSKGQVTLPKAIRSLLAIRTGDRVEFSLEPSNAVVLRRKREPGSSAGCGTRFVKSPEEVVSVEQMDEAVRRAMAKRKGAAPSRSR